MLDAMGKTNYIAVAANIAALTPKYDPKKESIRKRTQIQSTNNSNKSRVNAEGEPELPRAAYLTPQGSENKSSGNEDPIPKIDFVS
ncbi:MAG: hypothetical protein FJ264_08435 [Planctomycetes bacterium]|nr:hypothetical protein [Planctomycetota bacterium]